MASLPTISGREARDAFPKDGWTFARQRGSHMILIKPGHIASLSVPDQFQVSAIFTVSLPEKCPRLMPWA